jgi:ABC-type Na+ transport system ATPase subunit NatA
VLREPDKVRRSVGLTGQVATVDELLTGRENIRMIGSLYGIRRKDLTRLGNQLLEQFSIADAADRVVKSYSGCVPTPAAPEARAGVVLYDRPTKAPLRITLYM